VGTVEGLISALRETCAGLPDKRRGKNSHYAMADIGMAAFSVFFMQSPSFLAHQRHLAQGHGHGHSNCQTLFGMTEIPSDIPIRDLLDPVPPEHFYRGLRRRSKPWSRVVAWLNSVAWTVTC
jgi:hypothetical protein